MTLALLKGQLATAGLGPNKVLVNGKLSKTLVKGVLCLHDRSITVLQALPSFCPNAELSDDRGPLAVCRRTSRCLARGIAAATLRRHLAALVEAGLIERRDSPNGKRYAHRGGGGEIEAAFGFSLAPLLARAGELVPLATRSWNRVRPAVGLEGAAPSSPVFARRGEKADFPRTDGRSRPAEISPRTRVLCPIRCS